MTKHTDRSLWVTTLLGLVCASTLTACQNTTANHTNIAPVTASERVADEGTVVAAPPTDLAAIADADAVIRDVAAPSVWVRPSVTHEEESAIAGDTLVYGDTIRTQGEGLAEVDLVSGLSFRIGGEAALTLQPDNQLDLQAGQMIVWVEPGKQVPARIVTPVGIAGLRGTTLFISVPEDDTEAVSFLAWEGTIAIQVAEDAEAITLQSGEELSVRPGERDVANLRSRVRRLNRREIRQRRRRSNLLNRFQRSLPTLNEIEATLEAAP
ncbi:MAG: FecR domain-containing protein [Cyanobacteria bacterium J06638_20]